MIFVDTNYFLRFFLKDISSQHKKAKTLFQEGAEEKKKLFTNTIVFFEIYWVFSSTYQKNKREVIDILHNFLSLRFIQLEKRNILQESLSLFGKTNLELEDCYHLTYARTRNFTNFATFDQKLINALSV